MNAEGQQGLDLRYLVKVQGQNKADDGADRADDAEPKGDMVPPVSYFLGWRGNIIGFLR